MGGATFEYPGRSCVQETDSPTHCGQTHSGGVECRSRRGKEMCPALTQVTGPRHKTLLRQRRRLIGRCAAGMPTAQQSHDDRPRAPNAHLPNPGHTGEAAWSRRDIPAAVTLGTEPRGSSFGGAMNLGG